MMMAANEEAVIEKCLDSIKPIAGMIVFQNNSKNPDRTCSIVKEWCAKNKITLHLYDLINQGDWDPALHRNDVFKVANKMSTFEWLFRMDCDEWCTFDGEMDLSEYKKYHVLSPCNRVGSGTVFLRAAFYRKGIEGGWPEGQAAHEEFHSEQDLNYGYIKGISVHALTKATGLHDDKGIFQKYYREALGLERQVLAEFDGKKLDTYHLWYAARSYADIMDERYRKYFLSEDHFRHCMRRSIYLFETFLKENKMDEKEIYFEKYHFINSDRTWLDYGYLAYINIYHLSRSIGKSFLDSVGHLHSASILNPWRAEGLNIMREHYYDVEDWYSLFSVTSKMKTLKNPFPQNGLFVDSMSYYDYNSQILDNRSLSAYWIARKTDDKQEKTYYYGESIKDIEDIFKSKRLSNAIPTDTKKRLEENLAISKDHLKKLL